MDPTAIATVREFNRLATQRAGALDETYLSRGRPLAAARLLFEIGPEGTELRALRARLGLDSGHLSRLLSALTAEGLVVVEGADGDGRVRMARLTPDGAAERTQYDRLSDALAARLLAPLSTRQRRRLTEAMAEIVRLGRAAAVTVAPVPADGAAARACLAAYYAELDARFPGGFDPGAAGYASGSADDRFLVARLDGQAVGCGALARADAATAEIKRMWVAPTMRGLGIARRLLAALEAEALAMGARRVRLDTNGTLAEAQALYLAAGYAPVPRFNDNPYAQHWFAKVLAA